MHDCSEEPSGPFLAIKNALSCHDADDGTDAMAQEFANSKSIMKENQLSLLISQIAMATTL